MKQYSFGFTRWLVPVLCSCVLAVLRYPILYGNPLALVFVFVLQFLFSGYLLARVIGVHKTAHPFEWFAWILGAALALNITFGGLARVLQIPIPTYLLLLHALMAILACVRIPPVAVGERWKLRWNNAPLVGLLLLCCVITLGVTLARSPVRFGGYPDQTVFIELADWLANDPDDPQLRSRRIGVTEGDARWDTDGWTYTHATWIYSSGIQADDLIWTYLTLLLSWAGPLAAFGLVMVLTGRETTATWGAAAVTILGLLTLDALVYYPTPLAFGQFALFQVNTLRTLATALATPLALMPVAAFLHTPQRRLLPLILLSGLALSMLHPRQIMIFLFITAGTTLFWTIAGDRQRRWRYALMMAGVLVLLSILPFLQQDAREDLTPVRNAVAAATTIPTQTAEAAPTEAVSAEAAPRQPQNNRGNNTLRLRGRDAEYMTVVTLPGNLRTVIFNPTVIFYHPLIFLTTILGLLTVVFVRRSLAAQWIFASTFGACVLLFTPGLARLFSQIVTSSVGAGVIFSLPVALIYGVAIEAVRERLPANTHVLSRWLIPPATALIMLALLFEPVPIPASARDQIRASNAAQRLRAAHVTDAALITALEDILPDGTRSILLAPNQVSSAITEQISYTFITGGRDSSNRAAPGSARFLNDTDTVKPWLDADDLAYLQTWGVTHIVIPADYTRVTQLTLQPSRFELIRRVAGYNIFKIQGSLNPTRADTLYVQMNTMLVEQRINRWTPLGFSLEQPDGGESWDAIIEAWEALPVDDEQRLGLGFSLLMRGRDEEALNIFEPLRTEHRDLPLLHEVVAALRMQLNLPDPEMSLIDALSSDQAEVRVLAARRLLTPAFIAFVDDDELDRTIAVTVQDADIWNLLAESGPIEAMRERIVLMLSRERWQTAEVWSSHLPEAETEPRDLITRATIALAQNDLAGALSRLEPALEPDLMAANRFLHPDRWMPNPAAEVYRYLINGEVPSIEGANLVSLRDGSGANPYLQQVSIRVNDEGTGIDVSAVSGSPHIAPLPVLQWSVAITNADATDFYHAEVLPAQTIPTALTAWSVSLPLPEDREILEPGLVIVRALYHNRVVFADHYERIPLRLPPPAVLPESTTLTDWQFGENIGLAGFTESHDSNQMSLTLFWEANAPVPENYQLFVHILNESGELVDQDDRMPVQDRYPTRFWPVDRLIEDEHLLTYDAPLPPGAYRVALGLYRLEDLARLPVTPLDSAVQDDRLTLFSFTIPEGSANE